VTERAIVHRLREEYFELLPEITRVASRLETEIRFHTLSIQQGLIPPEQLIVKSRIKECESAIDTVRRKGNQGKGEGKVFDPERSSDYSIFNLRDLAGVRVLAFPDRRLTQVDQVLGTHFPSWMPDPVKNANDVLLVHKYHGKFNQESKVFGEYQVVPMLLGLYWEVEHAARYKSTLRGSVKISELNAKVESALSDFERGIANLLPDDSDLDSGS
jgi:hypothetical protein